MNLRKFVTPEFVFGSGAVDLVGQYAVNLGARRVLLVSDPQVVAAGWAGRAAASLTQAGVEPVSFVDITPNPRAGQCMDGAATYLETGCDVIVAVGGGSPMDCAKGIAVVIGNEQHVLEFEGVDNVARPGPPLLCVPTTAGSAADVSQFAIITDAERRTKIAIISKAVVPDVALIDPDTTRTMSPFLTACTGMDALVHAIEAFVSTAHSPIMDLHALEAIRLVGRHLRGAVAQPEDLEVRAQMMLASLQAGLAFSNASLGAVHSMAHSLGGYLDLPHGECNSILLAPVVRFNHTKVPERYRRVAEELGVPVAGLTDTEVGPVLAAWIDEFRASIGIESRLGQHGVREADVVELSRKAMLDACMVTNPREPVGRDIEVIFAEAI